MIYTKQIIVAVGLASISMTTGFAQGVQPRFSPPVEDRAGRAERVTPSARGKTPVLRARSATRGIQEVGDTQIVLTGVAPGLQLRNVRCKGVVCRTFEDSAGDLVIAVEGNFLGAPNSTMSASTVDMRTGKLVERRAKGVFSDGRFRDSVSTYRLTPGSYGVAYTPLGADEFYAGVQFEVVRHQAASSTKAGRAPAATRPDAAAVEAARRMQQCRALATNDNLSCGQ